MKQISNKKRFIFYNINYIKGKTLYIMGMLYRKQILFYLNICLSDTYFIYKLYKNVEQKRSILVKIYLQFLTSGV